MLPTLDKLLCAIDLSGGSDAVLAHAVALGRGLGAAVHVVHAVEPVNHTGRTMIADVLGEDQLAYHERAVAEALEKQLARHLTSFATRFLNTDDPGSVFETWRVIQGKAGPAIRQEAQRVEAGVLVVGMHGHSALEHLLIGSVARYLSQHSEVPLVLVPIDGAGQS